MSGSKTSTELQELHNGSTPEALSGGDEFMAVKPWVGALVPPHAASDKTDKRAEASTDVDLQLSWVYGYRAHGAWEAELWLLGMGRKGAAVNGPGVEDTGRPS